MLGVTFLLTLRVLELVTSEDSGSQIPSTAAMTRRPRFLSPDFDSHVVVEVKAGNMNVLDPLQAIPTTPRTNGGSSMGTLVSSPSAMLEGGRNIHPEAKVGPTAASQPRAATPKTSTAEARFNSAIVEVSTVGRPIALELQPSQATKSVPGDLDMAANSVLSRNDIRGFHMVEPLTQPVLHAEAGNPSDESTLPAALMTSSSSPLNASSGEFDTAPRDIDGGKVVMSAVEETSTRPPAIPSGSLAPIASLANSLDTAHVSTFQMARVGDKTTGATTAAIRARFVDDTVGHPTGITLMQNSSLSDHLTTDLKPTGVSTLAQGALRTTSASTAATESTDIRQRSSLEVNGTGSVTTGFAPTSNPGMESTIQARAGQPAPATAGSIIRGTAVRTLTTDSEQGATSQATVGQDKSTMATTGPVAGSQATAGLAGRLQPVTMAAEVPPFAQARAITAPDSEYIVPFAPPQRYMPYEGGDQFTHNHFIRGGYCGKCQKELRFCVQRCFETHSCEAPVNNDDLSSDDIQDLSSTSLLSPALTCPKIQIPCFPPYKPQPDACQSSADCEGLNHLCCLVGCSRKCVPGLVVPVGQH